MSQAQNVMILMKRYLAAMSQRIDDLAVKTSELEGEIRRQNEKYDKQDSENAELAEQMKELAAEHEQSRGDIDHAKEELKKSIDEMEANLEGFATYDSISEVQNKVEREIDSIRDEKLDRSDFQEFMNTYFAPLEELFNERVAGEGFAEFATDQAHHPKKPVEKPGELEEEATTAADEISQTLVPDKAPPDLSSIIDQRRHEKKKKKWL